MAAIMFLIITFGYELKFLKAETCPIIIGGFPLKRKTMLAKRLREG